MKALRACAACACIQVGECGLEQGCQDLPPPACSQGALTSSKKEHSTLLERHGSGLQQQLERQGQDLRDLQDRVREEREVSQRQQAERGLLGGGACSALQAMHITHCRP